MQPDKITQQDLDTAMALHAKIKATGMTRRNMHGTDYIKSGQIFAYIAGVAAILSILVAVSHC